MEENQIEQYKVYLDPFAGSYRKFECEDAYVATKVTQKFPREKRELYEMALLMEGFLGKKSSKLFVGRQQRFFKVIANGGYLAYFHTKPKYGQFSETPSGVYTIKLMTDIQRGDSPKE